MANDEEGKKSKDLSVRHLLERIEAKGSIKNTALKSTTQVAIGVGGGAVGAAILGKWSFIPGLLLIGWGNYKDIPWMAPMGIGMAASSLTLVADDGLKGVEGAEGFDLKTEATKAKQRLINLKDAFMSRTYLDKIFKKKEAGENKNKGGASQRTIESGTEEKPEDVNGLQDVPADAAQELENVEKGLIASAMEFQKKQQGKQVEGVVEPDLMGLVEEVDFSKL